LTIVFIDAPNASIEDLRMIASTLAQKQPGFYFMQSSCNTRSVFYAMISPDFAHLVDIQQFSTWLNSQGLRGGVSNNSIQGAGEKYNSHLGDAIKRWLQKKQAL